MLIIWNSGAIAQLYQGMNVFNWSGSEGAAPVDGPISGTLAVVSMVDGTLAVVSMIDGTLTIEAS